MDQETKTLINHGITLTFGGQPYQLKKLPIGKSEQWRARAADLDRMRMLAINASSKGEDGDETFIKSVQNNAIVFNHNPKYVTELVIEFCVAQKNSPLTREWLMENATDEEVAHAFSVILQTVLPFEFVTGGTSTMNKVMIPSSLSPQQ